MIGCSKDASGPINGNVSRKVESQSVIYETDNNGLLLKTEISTSALEPNKELIVKATIENISDKTLHYNGRCGNPIGISVFSSTEYLHLWSGEDIDIVCNDIYDPDDIVSLEPNEILSKEATYHPNIRIDQRNIIEAPEGDYNVIFSFMTEEKIQLDATYPIKVKNTDFPLLPLEEAISIAKKDPRVMKWMETIDQQYVRGKPILSEGNWHIPFKSQKSQYDRIIIAIDYQTGEVQDVNEV
ncbi:hypothetical protein [Metabacillus niabensis]|uniref:hypothetical protein n=1 Tax=Metabacillus niabensis TaxID=324854 RepID=UPI001CFAB3D9|nr:hypothetical protein [Metabacillus niabensis]